MTRKRLWALVVVGSIAAAALLVLPTRPGSTAAEPPKDATPAKKPAKRPAKAKKPKKPRLGWNQYKRVHAKIVRELLDGKDTAPVLKRLEALLADRPDDAETLWSLALTHTVRGNTAEAVAAARKAVGAGLPIGRFYAGPRELTAPLVKTDAFRTLAKEHGFNGLVHGPMVGCVTDTSAKFWVRTADETTVRVSVLPVDAGGRLSALTKGKLPKAGMARTSAKSDYTAVIKLTGLQPDTKHIYYVVVGNRPPAKGTTGYTFRTHPPAGKGCTFSVAFGGGAGYVPPNERVWDVIAHQKPRALLLLGDNVYIDMPTSDGNQRYCYYRRQSRPEFRRLTGATCVYSIWDDHDFGTNDCSGGPAVKEPAWKIPVWHTYKNNWVNPGYGGGSEDQPGCWYDFMIGDVHFVMMDCRYYRTNPRKTPEAERSMIGPVQKKWLKARIAASKGTFLVLASSVPWTFDAKGTSLDTWNGFKKERNEIFDCLAQNNRAGVLLISADRHRHDVWKIPRPNAYTLYEFESSRMTNQHVHGTMKKAEFSWNGHGFGMIDFDTTAADPTVTYRIISIDDKEPGGKEIHRCPLKRSQLQ